MTKITEVDQTEDGELGKIELLQKMRQFKRSNHEENRNFRFSYSVPNNEIEIHPFRQSSKSQSNR